MPAPDLSFEFIVWFRLPDLTGWYMVAFVVTFHHKYTAPQIHIRSNLLKLATRACSVARKVPSARIGEFTTDTETAPSE